MQTTRFRAVFLLLLPLAAACEKGEQDASAQDSTARRPDIIFSIPTLPRARQLDTAGSADAERVTWSAEMPYDTVVAFYRQLLPSMGWSVQSDEGDSLTRSLYMKKDSFLVWIRFENKGAALTQWTVIGSLQPTSRPSVADTGRRATPRVP